MKEETHKKALYQTVLTIVTGFILVFFLTGWQWTLIVACILGLGSVLSTRLAELIHWVWMEFARILGLFVPNVLLTIVFYVVLTPVAMLSKLFRKEPPVILDNKRESMFRDLNKTFKKEDSLKPW